MSGDNVVNFTGITRLDMDPERVLESVRGKLKSVVILGFDEDDEEYFASSIADGGTVVWLMERAKLKLLRMADGDGG